MGVSATHFDWTMVPYVRKSFYKHWQDAIRYIGQEIIPDDIDVFQGSSDMSINEYPKDKLYRYAIEQTKKEIHQATEGLYHNLK